MLHAKPCNYRHMHNVCMIGASGKLGTYMVQHAADEDTHGCDLWQRWHLCSFDQPSICLAPGTRRQLYGSPALHYVTVDLRQVLRLPRQRTTRFARDGCFPPSRD